jgi:hypothetical protein
MRLMKQSFLLSRSVSLLSERSIDYFYDTKLDVNCSSVNDINIPVVMLADSLTTQSKTFAAPGDDDPDREAESCY